MADLDNDKKGDQQPPPGGDENVEKLIDQLLASTEERWLKDSSLAALCCVEDRIGQ